MGKIGQVLGVFSIVCAQLVATGILLSVGFRLGDKLIDRIGRKK